MAATIGKHIDQAEIFCREPRRRPLHRSLLLSLPCPFFSSPTPSPPLSTLCLSTFFCPFSLPLISHFNSTSSLHSSFPVFSWFSFPGGVDYSEYGMLPVLQRFGVAYGFNIFYISDKIYNNIWCCRTSLLDNKRISFISTTASIKLFNYMLTAKLFYWKRTNVQGTSRWKPHHSTWTVPKTWVCWKMYNFWSTL